MHALTHALVCDVRLRYDCMMLSNLWVLAPVCFCVDVYSVLGEEAHHNYTMKICGSMDTCDSAPGAAVCQKDTSRDPPTYHSLGVPGSKTLRYWSHIFICKLCLSVFFMYQAFVADLIKCSSKYCACTRGIVTPQSTVHDFTDVYRYADGVLSLTYKGGDKCRSNFHRETTIQFECGSSSGITCRFSSDTRSNRSVILRHAKFRLLTNTAEHIFRAATVCWRGRLFVYLRVHNATGLPRPWRLVVTVHFYRPE